MMPSRQMASPPVDMVETYTPPPPAPAPVARPAPKPAAETPIDISIDEPTDLAELARKIEKKIR